RRRPRCDWFCLVVDATQARRETGRRLIRNEKMNEDGMTDKPYCPQQDIVTLMKQFNQQVKESPQLPAPETRLLRARLVFEEALEFVKGCGCTVTRRLARSNGEDQPAVIDEISVVLDPNGKPDFVEYVDG